MQTIWAICMMISIVFAVLSYQHKGEFFEEMHFKPSPLPGDLHNLANSVNLPQIKLPNISILEPLNKKLSKIPNLAQVRADFDAGVQDAVETISIVAMIMAAAMLALLIWFIPVMCKVYRYCHQCQLNEIRHKNI